MKSMRSPQRRGASLSKANELTHAGRMMQAAVVQDEQKRSHQTPPNERKRVDPTLSTPFVW